MMMMYFIDLVKSPLMWTLLIIIFFILLVIYLVIKYLKEERSRGQWFIGVISTTILCGALTVMINILLYVSLNILRESKINDEMFSPTPAINIVNNELYSMALDSQIFKYREEANTGVYMLDSNAEPFLLFLKWHNVVSKPNIYKAQNELVENGNNIYITEFYKVGKDEPLGGMIVSGLISIMKKSEKEFELGEDKKVLLFQIWGQKRKTELVAYGAIPESVLISSLTTEKFNNATQALIDSVSSNTYDTSNNEG